MIFKQSDILQGMDKGFIKAFMDIADKESYEKGNSLFIEGDPADFMYILLKGRVKLSIGEEGQTVYTVDHPGEVFGWSSLSGRGVYSASAECRKPTKLLRIEADRLLRILENDPASGLIFFRRLSGILGNRLLQMYRTVSDMSKREISPSYGTGQVAESDATVA